MTKQKKIGTVIVVVVILAPILLLLEMTRLSGAAIPRMLPAIIVIGAYYALRTMFKKDTEAVSNSLRLDKTAEVDSPADETIEHPHGGG